MADNPVPVTKIKGDPVTLFANPGYGAVSPAADKLSDGYVDCANYNAVSVTIYVPSGFTVTATVQGSPDPQGIYLALPDAQATQSALTTSKVFDVTVGQRYVKVKLSGITVPGGNPANNGIVVIVTPYDAAGQANISIAATANQNLTDVGGAAITLGQKAMANSLPVTLPNDETVPVSAASLPLPTGAAAAAQLPASLGQKAMAASTSVTVANDQSAVPVSATQLPASLGQKAMAASLPVVIASDQGAVPISQAATTHGKARNLGAVAAIKGAAGTLYGVQVVNSSAATAFVQIFDLATGGVTLGTTTPDLELEVAANSTVSLTLPAAGVAFAAAISAASTTTEGGAVTSAAGVQLFAQYA